MRATCAEMHPVLRDNAAAAIVVGDVKALRSALLIAKEAAGVGFEIDCIVDDVYKLGARSMLVLNSRKWGYDGNGHAEKSSVLIDRCLVLRKGEIAWRRPTIDWG